MAVPAPANDEATSGDTSRSSVDDLFTGALVLGVPSLTDQMASKVPGSQDGANQGAYCGN